MEATLILYLSRSEWEELKRQALQAHDLQEATVLNQEASK